MDGSLVSAKVPSPAKPFLSVGEASVDSLMPNTELDIPVTLLSAQALKKPLHLFFPDHVLLQILSYCGFKSYQEGETPSVTVWALLLLESAGLLLSTVCPHTLVSEAHV